MAAHARDLGAVNKHGVRSPIIQKLGKMMEGKMMEEKIRTPDNGSTIPVLHDFTLS
ncbi:MAG: hypothetical protein NTW21_02875 [Verrucomicrobia bacterium]|nr:hypothetical protein [Verrucomicrobiota bacterium]